MLIDVRTSRRIAAGLLVVAICTWGCDSCEQQQMRADVQEAQQQRAERLEGLEVAQVEAMESEDVVDRDEVLAPIRVTVTDEMIYVDNIAWFDRILQREDSAGHEQIREIFGRELPLIGVEEDPTQREIDDAEEAFEQNYGITDEFQEFVEPLMKAEQRGEGLEKMAGTSDATGPMVLMVVQRDVEFETLANGLDTARHIGRIISAVWDMKGLGFELNVGGERAVLWRDDSPFTELVEAHTDDDGYCVDLELTLANGGTFGRIRGVVGQEQGHRRYGAAPDSPFPGDQEIEWHNTVLANVHGECPLLSAGDSRVPDRDELAGVIDELEGLAPHCATQLEPSARTTWRELVEAMDIVAELTGVLPEFSRQPASTGVEVDDPASGSREGGAIARFEAGHESIDSRDEDAFVDAMNDQCRSEGIAVSEVATVGDDSDDGEMRLTMDRETLQVDGALDREIIHRVLGVHEPQLMACFESAARSDEVELSVGWVIDPAGQVVSADIDETMVDDPELSGCVSDAIEGISFPPANAEVRVEQQFQFRR